MKFIKGLLFIIPIAILYLVGNLPASSDNTVVVTDTLQLGNLEMVSIPPTIPSQIVNYEGMTLSFNKDLHIPNWVAWELTATEVAGTFPRDDNFRGDDNVIGSAEKWDYSYSGYDRGHMAPAGDMKWSEKAMDESFYMTNMCPQAKSLNTGAWKRLEEKCRQWAEIDSAIIVICGPVVTDSINEYIGDSKVAVPQRFFKVILSPYIENPRGIGFIMPNAKVPGGMQATAVSIDEVERVTGFDFFSSLPDEIENEVESQCKFHYWSTLKNNAKKKTTK
ncbi:MAG: DNA/RNA non-specific endonuclease [Muribaculaceae bacterium]|nr:DNA/RNA non-specific endonuclease [Muribaculaceae bacterium]